MTLPNTGERIYRLPAWINYVTQDLNVSATYDAVFWNPEKEYKFKNARPKRPESIRVYEAHGKVLKKYRNFFPCNTTN
jgi:1,4-alpha-glucan branching enzyme